MKRYLLPALILAWGMYALPLSTMGPGLEYIPGNLSDSRLNNYFLEHGYKWLKGDAPSFWNAPFFHPEPRAMAYSDNHLGTLPAYALFRTAGLDRETAYQCWMIVIFLLNFVCCTWVLRKLGINMPGAAAGAFVFTFALPVSAQMDHAQMLPRFAIPLAFYFAWRWFRTTDPRYLPLLCACAVWQFFCSIYLGFFLGLELLIFLFVLSIFFRKHIKKQDTGPKPVIQTALYMALSGIAVLALALMMRPYTEVSGELTRELGKITWDGISDYVPRIRSYFFPAEGSLLWNRLLPLGHGLPYPYEHRMFAGALPWLALAGTLGIALIRKAASRSNASNVFAASISISLLAAIVLTLYVNGASLYEIPASVSSVASIRAVTRIIMVHIFPFAAATAFFFDCVADGAGKRYGRVGWLHALVIVSLLAVLAADQYASPGGRNRYSKLAAQERSQQIVNKISKAGKLVRSFVYMPEDTREPPYVIHVDAMMASQSSGIPTLNGYSGHLPVNYDYLYHDYRSEDSLKIWVNSTINKYPDIADLPLEEHPFNNLLIIKSARRSDYFTFWRTHPTK